MGVESFPGADLETTGFLTPRLPGSEAPRLRGRRPTPDTRRPTPDARCAKPKPKPFRIRIRIRMILRIPRRVHGLRLCFVFNRPRGVTVSTLDSESSDRGSNPREAFLGQWLSFKCEESELSSQAWEACLLSLLHAPFRFLGAPHKHCQRSLDQQHKAQSSRGRTRSAPLTLSLQALPARPRENIWRDALRFHACRHSLARAQ